MAFWLQFRQLLRDLKSQKMRTFMTTFGIVWGTAAVSLLLPNQALHAQSVRWGQGSQEVRFEARAESWFREFLPSALHHR